MSGANLRGTYPAGMLLDYPPGTQARGGPPRADELLDDDQLDA